MRAASARAEALIDAWGEAHSSAEERVRWDELMAEIDRAERELASSAEAVRQEGEPIR